MLPQSPILEKACGSLPNSWPRKKISFTRSPGWGMTGSAGQVAGSKVGEAVGEGAGVSASRTMLSGVSVSRAIISGGGVAVLTGFCVGAGGVWVGLDVGSGEGTAIVAVLFWLHALIKMANARKNRAMGFITPRLYPIPQGGDRGHRMR